MLKETIDFIKEEYGIDSETLALIERAERQLPAVFARHDDIAQHCQIKVLRAFHKNHINENQFFWANGYGHDDLGREAVAKVYADALGAERCIVGPFIQDGTHALACTYFGLLRPGDGFIYCSGKPYDTMETVIGLRGSEPGTLLDLGVRYSQVDLLEGGRVDLEGCVNAIGPDTKMVVLQRSLGYSWRHAFSIDEIRAWSQACKSKKPDVICMVDNCYGEFTDILEPVRAGADIMAGSLMKNPGGGITMGGGYIAGRADLVEMAASRVVCPGLGTDSGLMYDQTRRIFQGLFCAPKTVCGAAKGAALFSKVFELAGYEVSPKAEDPRNDIVTAVRMSSPEQLIAFCEAVQMAAPINADFMPEPGKMSGYQDKIILASGSFVQGSTMEVSADAPLREPYTVYYQGGLSYEHIKFCCMFVVQTLKDRGLL